MSGEKSFDIAQQAANIENSFDGQLGYEKDAGGLGAGDVFTVSVSSDGGQEIIKEYRILEVFTFEKSEYDGCHKGVMLLDEETGNVIVHFNGTGDGNWKYNTAAYGGPPSKMQQECLKWFDEAYERHKNEITGELYVTGHSQGGNNAMFVTMRSENADVIDMCVPLDGPGFSNEFADNTIKMYSEEGYNERRSKIYAYNGEYDYVSILGQTSVVPGENVRYIKYSKDRPDFAEFHAATGLVDEHGKMELTDGESDLRGLIRDFADRLRDCPAAIQSMTAATMMKLCENYLGDSSAFRTEKITQEEFEQFKQVMLPILVSFISENSDGIDDILGVFIEDDEMRRRIGAVIGLINCLPEEDKIKAMRELLKLVRADGTQIVIVKENLADIYNTLIEIIDDNLENNSGITEYLAELLQKDPETFRYISGKITNYSTGRVITHMGLPAFLSFYEWMNDFSEKHKDDIETLNFIRKNFSYKYNKAYKETVDYSNNNPHIRVDTDELRRCASRISKVAERIRSLDDKIARAAGYSDYSDAKSGYAKAKADELTRQALSAITHGKKSAPAASTAVNVADVSLSGLIDELERVKLWCANAAEIFDNTESGLRYRIGG